MWFETSVTPYHKIMGKIEEHTVIQNTCPGFNLFIFFDAVIHHFVAKMMRRNLLRDILRSCTLLILLHATFISNRKSLCQPPEIENCIM